MLSETQRRLREGPFTTSIDVTDVPLSSSSAQERQREDEAERLLETQKEEVQAQALVRRQVKESLIWQKTLARDPLNHPVLR